MQILFLSRFDRRGWTWFEIRQMGWVLIRKDQIPITVRFIFEECEEIGLTDKLESWQLPCASLRDNDAGWTDVPVEELTVTVEKQQGLRDLQTAIPERNPLTFAAEEQTEKKLRTAERDDCTPICIVTHCIVNNVSCWAVASQSRD